MPEWGTLFPFEILLHYPKSLSQLAKFSKPFLSNIVIKPLVSESINPCFAILVNIREGVTGIVPKRLASCPFEISRKKFVWPHVYCRLSKGYKLPIFQAPLSKRNSLLHLWTFVDVVPRWPTCSRPGMDLYRLAYQRRLWERRKHLT